MTTSTTSSQSVGERLRWAREQAGLSQAQVARLLKKHRPTISQIEAGQRSVRPDEIAAFGRLYGVKEAWIVSGESILGAAADPRIELVARELSKLRKEDLDSILRLLKVLRSREEDGREHR